MSLAGETPTWFGRTAAFAFAGTGVAVLATLLAIGWMRSASRGPSDPSQWEQLTNFPDSATQPALSPDGRMLAFVRGEGTMAATGEIYLKHLPDGDATRDRFMKMDPSFSPDGNRIAYTVTFENTSMRSGWDAWEVAKSTRSRWTRI